MTATWICPTMRGSIAADTRRSLLVFAGSLVRLFSLSSIVAEQAGRGRSSGAKGTAGDIDRAARPPRRDRHAVCWTAALAVAAPLFAGGVDAAERTGGAGATLVEDPASLVRSVQQLQAEQPYRPRRAPFSVAIPARGAPFEQVVGRLAVKHGLSADFVHAVIAAESSYDPKARSPKGAMGLMQLMPDTARRYGVVDPWDPVQNIEGGVRYLRDLFGMFRDTKLTLAAYNAGEGAVLRHGNRVPPYAETKTYVRRVMALLGRNSLEAQAARPSGPARQAERPVGGPGWGIVLGVSVERQDAEMTVLQAWRRLGLASNEGARIVLATGGAGPGKRYLAAIAGLGAGRAGSACRRLRAEGAHCIAVTPKELGSSKVIWR